MRIQSQDGQGARAVRRSDGQAITLPEGEPVTIIDDKGSARLKNGYAQPGDEIVQWDGELYFVEGSKVR